ncbi:MAG TPA: 4-hydroxy-4-methyl-2-oxoglutarate aldolase [Rhodospirillaceae bacterium]|nr:4-hydroxy-4-methyl-2-oxoglutarate aldolase [Rhodospirillaceae bacterium]HAT34442.1 4-hydroxy-4-methyl-2-oxoglutarate aldolase [Rhodospirillaceae bacterium]
MSYVIKEMPPQVPKVLLDKAAQTDTATVGHIRHMGFVDRRVQHVLGKRTTVTGTAVTLAIPGQDSTLLHHVTQFLRPGDVLCIDRLGDDKHACLGGGVATAIVVTGCAAVIIDGPCTDVPEIEETGLEVWCKGTAPITTRTHDIGGSFNVPVSVGGSVVNPGDLVIADFSGVLVIPVEDAEEPLDWALAKQAAQPERYKKVMAGEKLGTLSGASAKVEAKTEK